MYTSYIKQVKAKWKVETAWYHPFNNINTRSLTRRISREPDTSWQWFRHIYNTFTRHASTLPRETRSTGQQRLSLQDNVSLRSLGGTKRLTFQPFSIWRKIHNAANKPKDWRGPKMSCFQLILWLDRLCSIKELLSKINLCNEIVLKNAAALICKSEYPQTSNFDS